MKTIKLYQIILCDGGGCGRYPTQEFFLDKKEAYNRCYDKHGGYAWESAVDASTEDGKYFIDGEEIFLFTSDDDEDRIYREALRKLTPTEIQVLTNRLR